MTTQPTFVALPNGCRVVVLPLPGARTVSIEVAIGGGLLFETLAEVGLGHLAEHMLLRRTARRSAEELGVMLDRLSNEHDGATGAETVTLSLPGVLPCDVERALDVLAEVLTGPAFDPLEVTAERRIVENEVKEGLDGKGYAEIGDAAHALVFDGSSLAVPSCGTLHAVRRMTAVELWAWHERHVVGGNVAVAIAGAVDVAEVMAAAERAFAGLPAGERLVPARAPVLQSKPRVRVTGSILEGDEEDEEPLERDPDELVQVALCLRAEFGRGDPRASAAEVLAEVLSGGVSSRLFVAMRLHTSRSYQPAATWHAYPGTGVLEITATIRAGEVATAIGEVLAVCEGIACGGPTAERIGTVRIRLGREPLDVPAEDIARDLADGLLHDDLETTGQRAARLASVSADEVRDVARQLLRRHRVSVAASGDVTEEELREAIERHTFGRPSVPDPTPAPDLATLLPMAAAALPPWARAAGYLAAGALEARRRTLRAGRGRGRG